jgi:alanine-glyoxylate transaminase/serine-glyoxylate transaminase/serine-pyruvate transaminase
MEAFRKRTRMVGSLYADWSEWLPIMEAYEARKPAYFATPAVNLIWALNVSLKEILAEGMETRFARHRALSAAFKAGVQALGLRQLPARPDVQAATLSAIYYPDGVDKSLVKCVDDAGVIIAGGLHPALKEKYFRVGHMGGVSAGDILATLGAIESGLHKCRYKFEKGAGVAAAQQGLMS